MIDDKIHREGRTRQSGRGAATDHAAAGVVAADRPAPEGAASPVGEEKEKTGLRPAPIIAGGIAATTAAFLCSFFGVYGTVIGTGAISVLSTVGSEFYLRSMRRSREAARRAKAKAAALAETKSGGRAGGRTAVMRRPALTAATAHRSPAEPTRRILSNAEQPTDYLGVPHRAGAAGDGTAGLAGDASTRRGLLRRRWPVLAATSAVVFGIGMLVLTGFELAAGESLNGQGRSTVGAIVGDRGPSGPGDGAGDVSDGDAPAPQQDMDPADAVDPSDEATSTEQAPQPADETDAEQPTEPQPADEQEMPAEQDPATDPAEVDEPAPDPVEQPAEPEAGDATPAP